MLAGVGQGHTTLTPVEERTLTSGVLVEEGDGAWIGVSLQTTELKKTGLHHSDNVSQVQS